MPRIQDIGAFSAVREAGLAKLVPAVPRIAVGMGTCGRGNGAEGLYSAFAQAIERSGADMKISGMIQNRPGPRVATKRPKRSTTPR